MSDTTLDTVDHYQYDCKIKCKKCKGTGYEEDGFGILWLCSDCKGVGYVKRILNVPSRTIFSHDR